MSDEEANLTTSFPAAFMRHDVGELASFPSHDDLEVDVGMVEKLAPGSLSVPELKGEQDVAIANKLVRFPLLGADETDDPALAGKWKLKLTSEFHMTNDSHLFKTSPADGRLVLYQGGMIEQFTHTFAEPKYWVDEDAGRQAILGKRADEGQKLAYEDYRVGLRAVASSTNRRSLIATVVPRNVFCGNSLLVSTLSPNGEQLHGSPMVFCTGLLDSYVLDYLLRNKVTTNINMFYIYQLPVPRYGSGDPYFEAIVARAGRLICTTPEYDALAQEIGLQPLTTNASGQPVYGYTAVAEREQARAELDARVAHLYSLTEDEYAHVLSSFKITDSRRALLLAEYGKLVGDHQVMEMIDGGENERVEFKEVGCIDPQTSKKGKEVTQNVVRAVAAFLNSKAGGTLLIGVTDESKLIVGVEREYKEADQQKQSWDGYLLYLRNSIKDKLGPNCLSFVQISPVQIGGKTICRIDVSPADQPTYLNKVLPLRDTAGTSDLSEGAMVSYVQSRWPR